MASPCTRNEYVFMAKVADQAECYPHMMNFMNKLVHRITADLTVEERDLLSKAYRNIINPLREKWRTLKLIERVEDNRENDERVELVQEFRCGAIERDIRNVCSEILDLLDDHLIPSAFDDESKALYYKMKADYISYTAEIFVGDDRILAADLTVSNYKIAQEIAYESLSPMDPLRLGLALNYSVFCYNILCEPEKACNIAAKALVRAIDEIDDFCEPNEESPSRYILQSLRENLSRWTSDTEEDDNSTRSGNSSPRRSIDY